MACPHCGSWSVKADRSLAGRLVCGRCGLPLGAGQRPVRPRRRSSRRSPARALGQGLLALLALSALLAAWDLQRTRSLPRQTPFRSGLQTWLPGGAQGRPMARSIAPWQGPPWEQSGIG